MTNWVRFFVEKPSGEPCSHFKHSDVKEVDELIYKLLCFIHLSDTEELILQPGAQTGTKKTGKLINDFPFKLTIINSRWNITSIRTEGFDVRGHFAIRWAGAGRTDAKMVWIEPFQKKGYKRTAGKELQDEAP